MHTYNLFPAENNLIVACKTANILRLGKNIY